jgi:hypothetical protein
MAYTVRGDKKKGFHITIPTEAMRYEKPTEYRCEIIISKGTIIKTIADGSLLYTPVRT